MDNLAGRLKIVREHLNKTQKDMSILLDLSANGWQVYERGTNVPGGKVLEVLARQGFNVNWILTGEGEMRRDAAAPPGKLDEELLEAVLEAVEDSLEKTGMELKSAKKAQLIKTVYEMMSEQGSSTVDKATVIRLFKLAA